MPEIKKYAEIYLNEKNIKAEKEKSILVSFPKLGLVSLSKNQVVVFTNKNSKNGAKKAKIVLSEDKEYSFLNGKNEDGSNKITKMKGSEIVSFYNQKWQESKEVSDSKAKCFVSSRIVEKQLKEKNEESSETSVKSTAASQ